MRCDQIQPNLLDYGKGRLSASESSRMKLHLDGCAECRTLLEEEMAFDLQLSAVQHVEEPANDVWALVRTRTRPKHRIGIGWLRAAFGTRYSKAAATVVALGAVAAMVFSNMPVEQKQESTASVQKPPAQAIAVVNWSDDPLGDHTDAMVDLIDKM